MDMDEVDRDIKQRVHALLDYLNAADAGPDIDVAVLTSTLGEVLVQGSLDEACWRENVQIVIKTLEGMLERPDVYKQAEHAPRVTEH